MNEEIQGLIKQRPFKTQDREFLVNTWLKSLYHGNPWFKAIDETVYTLNYEAVIHRILANPETKTIVGCLAEDPSTIVGFSTYAPGTLHFIYVKPQWRKVGIARALLPPEGFKNITHLTKIGWAIKPAEVIFNPFLL